MKTIFFKDHRKTNDDGYNLYCLLNSIRGQSNVRIEFEKQTYEIKPDRCFERCLYISNHGWNGLKRIVTLIENMDGIELDFCGSTILCRDVMTPFAILNSRNVTVKNVTLENPNTYFYQARVTAHGDGYIDLERMVADERFVLRRGELVAKYRQSTFVASNSIEYNGKTGEIEYGVGDHSFGEFMWNMDYEDLGNGKLRLKGVKRYPPIGNVAVISAARRLGCGFFCEDSSDIRLENVTIHSCFGMGILAQTCHNITLDSFNTLRHGDYYYTANADSTHFVNCTGTVCVENSTFEGQLDDALNIHGMYTSIFDKTEHELFVHEVHEEAKGIRIYRAGDRIQILKPNTLIPYTEKTVREVEYINEDTIRIVLCEDTGDIQVGDDVESLTRAADLIFRNNVVRNNRARGMLVATRGKAVIENCYFHTSGCAILFEANGEYWYESGGVQDVTIRNNTFDGCKYSVWGSATVECAPRKATESGKYFSREIKVIDNKFHMINDTVVAFDNLEHVVYSGNTVSCEEGVCPKITLHHVGNAEIDGSVAVEEKLD